VPTASTLVRVPDSLSNADAIFAEPAAVAIHAAWRRPPQDGERVLVLGCGTIGLLLLQVLCTLQPRCQLTAVAQFPWQVDLAQASGADHVFLSSDNGDFLVARATGAKLYEGRARNRMLLGGFDLIFDVVGNEVTLNRALRWARARGTVVLVGVNLHRMRLDVTPVWYQEVNLLGAVGHDIVTFQGQSVSTFELAMSWMQSGTLRCAELLTHRFPIELYHQAFAVAADKQTHRSVKVAFAMAGNGASPDA
jgi:threonine dehydrogenase-like Zn-dependent dehydrogenase